MLELFVEGERLLKAVEAKDFDLITQELPIWQDQVIEFSEKNIVLLQEDERKAQIAMLQDITQRIAKALDGMGKAIQAEIHTVQKQQKVAKTYMNSAY